MFSLENIKKRFERRLKGSLNRITNKIITTFSSASYKEKIRTLTTVESSQSFTSVFKQQWKLLFLPLTTTGLCIWQIVRAVNKKKLYYKNLEKARQDPIPLPPTLTPEQLDELEFRKVTVTGRFLHDQELYVFLRAHKFRTGLYIITPFQRSDGGPPILVNRGWIPPTLQNPSQRPQTQIAGEVTLTGYLRKGERPTGFVIPVNDIANKRWYWIELDRMAEVAETAPILVDAIETKPPVPGNYPICPVTQFNYPSNHIQYALTWFVATVLFTGAFIYRIRKEMKTPITPKREFRRPI